MSERAFVKKIVLHTGNIIEKQELVRKVGKSTLEELHACVKSTLNDWKKQSAQTDLLEIGGSDCTIRPNLIANKPQNGLKTTVKVFLSRNSAEDLVDAIETVKSTLRLDQLDTVIIVPPDVSDALILEDLMTVWKALEAAVIDRSVGALGVADLSPDLFKQLYEWAEVKPSIIQLNLSACCTVSEELMNFTSQRELQVLTHTDDPEVIDEDLIGSILSRAGLAGAGCELSWLARHRTIQTCYGLVASKGYSLAMEVEPSV